jgi:hypothetical protein
MPALLAANHVGLFLAELPLSRLTVYDLRARLGVMRVASFIATGKLLAFAPRGDSTDEIFVCF